MATAGIPSSAVLAARSLILTIESFTEYSVCTWRCTNDESAVAMFCGHFRQILGSDNLVCDKIFIFSLETFSRLWHIYCSGLSSHT